MFQLSVRLFVSHVSRSSSSMGSGGPSWYPGERGVYIQPVPRNRAGYSVLHNSRGRGPQRPVSSVSRGVGSRRSCQPETRGSPMQLGTATQAWSLARSEVAIIALLPHSLLSMVRIGPLLITQPPLVIHKFTALGGGVSLRVSQDVHGCLCYRARGCYYSRVNHVAASHTQSHGSVLQISDEWHQQKCGHSRLPPRGF